MAFSWRQVTAKEKIKKQHFNEIAEAVDELADGISLAHWSWSELPVGTEPIKVKHHLTELQGALDYVDDANICSAENVDNGTDQSQNTSADATEQLTDNAAFDGGHDDALNSGDNPANLDGDQAIECATDNVAEQSGEQAADKAGDDGSECAGNQAADKAGDESAQQQTEQGAEKATDDAVEQATEQGAECATNQAADEASQLASQDTSENANIGTNNANIGTNNANENYNANLANNALKSDRRLKEKIHYL